MQQTNDIRPFALWAGVSNIAIFLVGNILRVITRTLEKVFINCINAHDEMEKQERENLGKLNTHLEAAENKGSSNHQDLILFEFRKKSGEEKYKDRDS